MKRLPWLLLPFLALLMGCTQEVLPEEKDTGLNERVYQSLVSYQYTGELPTAPALKNQVTRPMKVRSSGTLAFNPYSSNCQASLPIEVTVQGSGIATHLGNFTVHLAYCTDGLGVVSHPLIATSTAANGDQMFAMLVGAGYDPELGYYQSYLIIGGTGRFMNAGGNYTLYGYVDYANGVFSHEGEGVITY